LIISAELSKKYNYLISQNYNQKKLKRLDVRTNTRIKLGSPISGVLVIEKQ
jgi:hypothetical protein